MSQRTFDRSHVEWAIWTGVSAVNPWHADPPDSFRKRIKKLLDLDRTGQLRGDQEPPTAFAFTDAVEKLGSGNDVTFTRFNAFCLFIAVDLLHAGCTENEAVLLIRYVRPKLQECFASFMAGGCDMDALLPSAYVLPYIAPPEDGSRPQYSHDKAFFMVVRRLGLAELKHNPRQRLAGGDFNPELLEPAFCDGHKALAHELSKLPYYYRNALVQELTWPARWITSTLSHAPKFGRGRSRSQALSEAQKQA